MIDLFRYMEWRLPEAEDANSDAIRLTGESSFRNELRLARQSQQPAEEMAQVAASFAESGQFVADVSTLNFSDAYERAIETARHWNPGTDQSLKLSSTVAIDVSSLTELIAVVFDVSSLTELIASEKFLADKLSVQDSLIALKIISDERQKLLDALVRMTRAIELVERAERLELNDKESVTRILDALVIVPDELLILERTPPKSTGQSTSDRGLSEEIARLEQRRRGLELSYQVFSTLGSDQLAFQDESPITLTPAETQQEGQILSALDTDQLAFPHESTVTPRAAETQQESQFSTDFGAINRSLFLRNDTMASLPSEVQSSLAELSINTSRTDISEVVLKVKDELAKVQHKLSELVPLRPTPVYHLGQYFFTLSAQTNAPAAFLDQAPKVKIRPIGFGDLQVVKQQIVRYEPGEVSYIENVLKSEQFSREVQRREMEEETTISERERIKEEERDLQATDRFELRTESEETSRRSTTTTAGNTVTSQYGSLVENRSSNFARDVVNRAVNKLTERVREQRTVRIQRELIEKTVHAFDNSKDGAHNISGVYQWVDKIYQAQVYNFGKRLLYEAVIPEPAAFLIEMRKSTGQPESMQLQRPPAPNFGPKDLQAWNYLGYAKLYDVVGAVEPPPDEFLKVTKKLQATFDNETFIYKTDSVPIPAGYYASRIIYIQLGSHFHENDQRYLIITIGYNEIFKISASNKVVNNNRSLKGETDELPIFIRSWGYRHVVMNLMVFCQRLNNHMEKWQIRTYETLVKGYRKQLSEYEERLANLQALARTQMLLGGGATRNRETERTELKKAFLTLLTNQHFDAFSGIETSVPLNYPQTAINAAVNQAGFISFFERAFEWENMLYFFYPYFWGRKAEWDDRLVIQDSDPQFEAFLKAGAARVVVPVRPGFEGALAHYIETGKVWFGEGEPNIYSPLFVSILREIRDRDKAAGDEIPVGDPWEVRLPTTLVTLRDDAKLPEWEQDATGKWGPKN